LIEGLINQGQGYHGTWLRLGGGQDQQAEQQNGSDGENIIHRSSFTDLAFVFFLFDKYNIRLILDWEKEIAI